MKQILAILLVLLGLTGLFALVISEGSGYGGISLFALIVGYALTEERI